MLEWVKRGKKMDTVVSERMRWRSKCGQYAVERSEIRYGKRTSASGIYLGYKPVFRALHKRGEVWDILSEHTKRGPAERQCEYHDEHGTIAPRNTKLTKAKRRLKKKRQERKKKKEA